MKKTIAILVSTFSFYFCSAQSNLDSGLVASYSFTGNAADSSGNNNDGIVYGATLTTGKAGIPNTAYHFDGVSNYIEVPNSASLAPGPYLSMCALVRPMGFYSGPCQGNMIFIKGDDISSGGYYMSFGDNPYDNNNCSAYDPTHQSFFAEVNGNYWAASAMAYSDYIIPSTWYCLTAIWNGTQLNMYIDGIHKFTVTGAQSIGANSHPLTIGRMIYYPNTSLFKYWFNGDIDDIRIYKRALTSEELKNYCDLATGIKTESSLENVMQIFPNPSTGEIHIAFGNEFSMDKAELRIMDVSARVAYEKKLKEQQAVITCSLAKGIYFAQLKAKDRVITKKIVIQ
jgi:hypothetical protein